MSSPAPRRCHVSASTLVKRCPARMEPSVIGGVSSTLNCCRALWTMFSGTLPRWPSMIGTGSATGGRWRGVTVVSWSVAFPLFEATSLQVSGKQKWAFDRELMGYGMCIFTSHRDARCYQTD